MTTELDERERQARFDELWPVAARFFDDLENVEDSDMRLRSLAEGARLFDELATLGDIEATMPARALRPPSPPGASVRHRQDMARLCRLLEHIERRRVAGGRWDRQLWPELEEAAGETLHLLASGRLTRWEGTTSLVVELRWAIQRLANPHPPRPVRGGPPRRDRNATASSRNALERPGMQYEDLVQETSRLFGDGLWPLRDPVARAEKLSETADCLERIAALVAEEELDTSRVRRKAAIYWAGVGRLCRVLEHVERCRAGRVRRDRTLWPELEAVGADALDRMEHDELDRGERGDLIVSLTAQVGQFLWEAAKAAETAPVA